MPSPKDPVFLSHPGAADTASGTADEQPLAAAQPRRLAQRDDRRRGSRGQGHRLNGVRPDGERGARRRRTPAGSEQ